MSSLSDLVQEVVDATKLCPESLQLLAFEILLKHQLSASGAPRLEGRKPPPHVEREPLSATEDLSKSDPEVSDDEDIATKDLHAKARKFLQDHSLSVADLNALYYKEGSEIKPLYDDLRSTGMSESQIRLGLLEALESAIATGSFEFRGESIRDKCKVHKCYDRANFTRNFRNNTELFDNFETYEAATPIRLSVAGRQKLATVITDLARST